ncbi:MAG: dipicolinate synthase [Ruminococcaceae bacterium]|nr:dipicolinate synthase [Oscillospiraceae bacterium]
MTLIFCVVNLMNILLIGGDRRQEIVRDNLKNAGHLTEHITKRNQLNMNFDDYDCIVFPYPTTKDGLTVNNTLSEDKLFLAEIIKKINRQKVLCGNYSFVNIESIDYGKDDELTFLNAVPTAEGAIEIAIKNTPHTLWKSNCLVVGNGKCGKILADRLKGLRANVTVSARRDIDFAFIKAQGFNAINTYEIKNSAQNYDIIFNTVDSLVLDEAVLKGCKKDCLIIELASAPFGVDFKYAEKIGIPVIIASGLPGKCAPQTAAEILTTTIIKLITNK